MIMEENEKWTNENSNELPIGDEKEYLWVKENIKWGHKVYAVIAAIVVAFIAVIFGIHFGIQGHALVEDNWFQEVTKWIVGSLGVAGIVCVISYVPVELSKLARIEYYPKYGKNWFWKAFKTHILGKKLEK